MRRTVQIILLGLLASVFVDATAAEKLSRKQRKELLEVQESYAATLRWVGIQDALSFIDPEYRKAHPLTELELSRYDQVKVSGYRERDASALPNGTAERRMEVNVVNQNTQSERTIVVRETWRWDKERKRWWQTSGLPDLWPER
mgnify:CR=1 FL=1